VSRYVVVRGQPGIALVAILSGDQGWPLTVAFRRAKLVAGWKNDELRLPEVPA